MADKKTIKAAKQATEVKTIDQLRTELTAKQNDLNEAKRGHKLGELTNPRAITTMRKEIARLHTAIRADELKSAKENK
ncbi:50S ribosomal protein L29 [Candidatus Saccharibacteria bacterium HGW-Saccharibacteria-1]|jgi:ribosomal protein L29|nr:MAG: 50S ribosomal protein L29 [Candidatus Saccharibacteria bacterium HGW-Saccharibacteria-1]